MNEADREMLEELRDAAKEVQLGRGDEPVRRLGAALEAYAMRCLADHAPDPTIETAPVKPQ